MAEVTKCWWTLNDIRAAVFGNAISPSTLQKLVNEKKIPSKRFGNRKIYVPDWWVQKQRSGGMEESGEAGV